KNLSAPFAELRELCGLRFCLRVCLWQLPTQQLSQICRRATHSHVEMPEQRVHCADFVKSHLVNQFLEHQRIVRPQIYSPLPIVEADRSRNNLLHLARVPPPHNPMLGDLSPAFFNWQRVPRSEERRVGKEGRTRGCTQGQQKRADKHTDDCRHT